MNARRWPEIRFGLSRYSLIATASVAVFLIYASGSDAAQQGKIPRIGIIEPGEPAVCSEGFKEGLRSLGYIEGQNISLVHRSAEGHHGRLPLLASELAESKPDLIWTHSPPAVHAVKKATSTVPIVVGVAFDLVEQGIVVSLARPGGNVTGMELSDSDVIGKRLEILKQAVPKASRIAVWADPTNPSHAVIPGNFEREARSLVVGLHRIDVSSTDAFDHAFRTIADGSIHAIILPESALFARNREHIFKRAISNRVPTASGGAHFADAGSLLSYGANVRDICRRSANFVDRILKGTKASELPVERPSRFELVINLKTAKQIGVTIPPSVLARADRVIR